MNIANFTFVPGLDRRLPTTILHRWVSLQSWKTTAEVALVCPSCRTFQKKYGISWTKRGVAETYCTMYGHGMYDPAKHEEHCWPVATVWQWVGSVGSSYVWRWGCCFSILEAKLLILPEELKTSHVPQIMGVPCDFQRNARSFVKSFLDYMGEVTVSGSQNSLQRWQRIVFKYLWIWDGRDPGAEPAWSMVSSTWCELDWSILMPVKNLRWANEDPFW